MKKFLLAVTLMCLTGTTTMAGELIGLTDFPAPSRWKQLVNMYPHVFSHEGRDEQIELTADRRTVILSVHNTVSQWPWKADPRGIDKWDITLPGDCENHALAKYHDLVTSYNFSPANLSLGICHVERDGRSAGGHAVLVIRTTEGDLAVDVDNQYFEPLTPVEDIDCMRLIWRSLNNDTWQLYQYRKDD